MKFDRGMSGLPTLSLRDMSDSCHTLVISRRLSRIKTCKACLFQVDSPFTQKPSSHEKRTIWDVRHIEVLLL